MQRAGDPTARLIIVRRIHASRAGGPPVDIRLVNRYLTYFFRFPHGFLAGGAARILLSHIQSPGRDSTGCVRQGIGSGKLTVHRSITGSIAISMSPPETVVVEPSISVPIGDVVVAVERRDALGLRPWLLTAMLFLLPLVTYWPATFHDFGLRDDYSNLREAHEEPGKVVKFCASHARPIYGWLLQSTYGQTSSVQDLQWMRFGASLLLGALSLISFRGLRVLGWSFSTSLCFAVLLALIPSAQVMAGWAVGWPYVATALLAFGGCFPVEGAFARGVSARPGRAVGPWMGALGLTVVSALIYPPSAMFYVVPLAGALIVQRHRSLAQTARWAGIHLGFLVSTLGLAYCVMSVLYAT